MRLVRAAAAGLALGSLVAAGATGARAEVLKIGNEGTYPPFSIVDSSGQVVGVEPDLAREVCKRMNVECEIVAIDFKALIPSMLQGKFDLIATQLAPTAERAEKGLFSRPIVYNPTTFVVPASSDWTFTAEGLAGKKIGLQRGAATIKYIETHFGKTMEFVLYDNPDQIKLDLLAGRIDMTFDSKINWTMELIKKPEGKDWKLVGDHWIGDPSVPEDKRGFSWFVRKDSQELLDKVNVALDAIIADCTYTKIRAKYLDVPTLQGDADCVAKMN
ncbi:transporter substrate-binding domain-containing protein [Chthonobacter rhizosphaerae]|uniref:transporter substrate-binding domain-containing protein n=1 Tax=Chthonobacter rhizosphaerae TaxID=2735553 RepID=UPI0015EE5E69|nr:transporter substrate-binding domain-containing protein [Chthonobacter rhizosphaerae]